MIGVYGCSVCRHLCEFTGLDFEMAIYEHYYEVLEVGLSYTIAQ